MNMHRILVDVTFVHENFVFSVENGCSEVSCDIRNPDIYVKSGFLFMWGGDLQNKEKCNGRKIRLGSWCWVWQLDKGLILWKISSCHYLHSEETISCVLWVSTYNCTSDKILTKGIIKDSAISIFSEFYK